ncbi:LPXTG cell wall anchor domain-containing protein [Cnuibacter physcomitrellae]|uniref:LPXTG cell wall anchor domain-containing protein n=1 Tax=Cnuibacter physcomitrellae TaxID=1619308 RepID=UPI0021760089|nr:LPXTG cell wall anchor domain-containing protein [Cnuibacter physcomitrellae]MCS5498625.1 LPXTG cell wall anchor domain-containing protein [Cnuibacter physcomitrellae]
MHHTSRLARAVAAGVVAGASSLTLAAGGVALAGAAHAALIDVPPTGQPGRLVLSSDPYPAEFLDLSPGDAGYWEVGARIEGATKATLSLELRKSGDLVEYPRGLSMTVDVCAVEWTGLDSMPVCPTGAERITVATPENDYATSSPTFDLEPLTAAAPEYLLITLAVEDSPEARADQTLMGLTGDMAVGLTASAFDDVPVRPGGGGGGTLPNTGGNLWALGAVGALAAGLLGIGTAFRISRKEEER